jgi:hypothetical protein
MFIAWQSSLYSEAPIGAQSLLPGPPKIPLPGFASNGARSFGRALVAINISLRWSENDFNCGRCKLKTVAVVS